MTKEEFEERMAVILESFEKSLLENGHRRAEEEKRRAENRCIEKEKIAL